MSIYSGKQAWEWLQEFGYTWSPLKGNYASEAHQFAFKSESLSKSLNHVQEHLGK